MSKRSFDLESRFEKCQNTKIKFIWNQPNSGTQPQIVSLVARTAETTVLMDTKITISLTDWKV